MSHNNEIKEHFLQSQDTISKYWSKGDFLCREGNELAQLHFIVSGRFRIFRSLNNGREMLYRIYLPGSIIGDIEIFTGSEAASCSVQCIETAETLALSMEKLRANPAASAELIFSLGKGIARKLHENSVSEALNTAYPLDIRLAHYYLTFVDPELRSQNLGQLADWMGCSYRHLTRSLAALKKRGAIRHCEKGYEAANMTVLKSIAEPMLLEENGRVLFEPGEQVME